MRNIRDAGGGMRLGTGRKASCLEISAMLLVGVTALAVSTIALAGNLDKVVYFHIKAQSLEKALLQFGEQAHEQIVFASKSAITRSRTTGLTGKYTERQALRYLLKGSNFEFVENGDTAEIVPNTFLMRRPQNRRNPQQYKKSQHIRATLKHSDPEPTKPSSKSTHAAKHKAYTISEVVVTGTHIAGATPISPSTTISAIDIKNSGLPDVASVIRSLPQFYSGGMNPNAVVGGGLNGGFVPQDISTANLRGLGPNATLTLIDGHRMAPDGLSLDVDLSSIPTAAVKRVEIDTGGASAIYGANAVAGVVNIILRKSYNGEHSDIYIGGTTNGGLIQRYNQIVGRTFAHGTAGVLLGYQFQSSDEILRNQRRGAQAPSSTSTIQPQTKSNALFISTHYDVSSKVSGTLEGFYNHRTSLNSFYSIEKQQGLVDQFSINGGLTFALRGNRTAGIDVTYAGDSESDLSYAPSIPAYAAPFGQEAFQNRLLEIDISEQGKLLTLPGRRSILTAVGAGFARESFADQIAGNFPPSTSVDRRRHHAYVEIQIPIFPKSTLTPGIERLTFSAAGRYENYDDFGSIVVPKLGLSYSPVKNITVSGTWGRAFQPPQLGQLYVGSLLIREPSKYFIGLPPGGQVLVVSGANRSLQPEKAITRTLTIQWNSHTRQNHSLYARVSYYDINFNGVIQVPIDNLAESVSNTLYAPYVDRNPSAQLQNAVAASVQSNLNPFGLSVNPASVNALIFNQLRNISKQTIHGFDVNAGYDLATQLGQFSINADASWESFSQQLIKGAVIEQISGTIFNPPKFKSRFTVGWDHKNLGITLFINHISDELNTATVPMSLVPSWTTVDGQLRYSVHSIQLRISGQNLLNSAPPSIPNYSTNPPGMGFDPNNYSAIGRFLSVEVSAKW